MRRRELEWFHPNLAKRKQRESRGAPQRIRRAGADVRLHFWIFRAMRILIALNSWSYGEGASREVLRDLQGD